MLIFLMVKKEVSLTDICHSFIRYGNIYLLINPIFFEMKTILLPTDFSENALNTIRFAVRLFPDEACTFYLLNT